MGATRHQRGRSRQLTAASGTTGAAPAGHGIRAGSRSRAAVVGGVALGLTSAALAGLPAQAIDSNPPTGPGNIEVFPNRDMIAIEGYGEQAGKTATITVRRGGQVVGSTVGTVDATGFLEVNHPGGVCWGAGTDLKVTPDIRANDDVRVEFSDGHFDGSKVVDVEATGVVVDEVARTLTIDGRYGPGVDMPGADLVADPGKFGIEIVNPDMRDATSGIGERAIGWPSDEAPAGYTVNGSVTGTDAAGGTFSVTYGFQTDHDLELANAGSITALGWLADLDPALGEAQLGLSLHEFYEFGGPGMGGCPAGPTEVRTNGPAQYTGKGAGDGRITVEWDAATPTPGAPAVTGYTVRAVNGEDEKGKRLGADARSTTIDGLVPNEIYSVEIAAKSAAGEGDPAVIARLRAADHVVPTATATTSREPDAAGKYLPLVTNANGDFGVFLDPAEGVLDAEVHYTTDGTTPTLKSRTFVSGADDSIQIRQDTTLRWIVVDSGNVVGPQGEKFFDLVESDSPAPTGIKAVPAPVSGAVDVSWPRVDDPAVEAYRVQAYTGSSTDVATGIRVGTAVNVAQPTGDALPAEVSRRVAGLTNGTPYRFTVAARYGNVWTAESELSAPVAPEPPASVDAGADQTSLRARTVTLDGSRSQKVLSYQWTQVRPRNAAGYQDPLVTITNPATAKPTFVFPTKSSPTSDDGVYQFRLTTTHPNPDPAAATATITKTDLVDVREQRDVVVATEARWRAGNALRMSGTGSQNGARLTFRDGSATGAVIGTATVAGGTWTAPGVVVNLSTGSIYVWSDHGFVGNIQTTR